MRRLSRFRRRSRPSATVRPTTAAGLAGEATIPKSVRRWQLEPTFGRLVDHALEATGAPVPCDLAGGPAARLFHLVSLLDFVREAPGAMAEVGVYRGESALLACKWRQLDDPGFRGEGFHLFDSFAGLSDLGPEDYVEDRIEGFRPRHAGMFSASLDAVRAALAEFPEITFHPGWIPECFETGPDVTYRYVHIDVDTYQPTLDSLR
ncbi:MAG: TylF/MycF/NovP-related O-methyltransferase, partial [Actinomycetota bacterium]